MDPTSEVFSREEYAQPTFWNDRYAQNVGLFDWYAQFPELKKAFEGAYHLEKHHRILMVGCGNSKLSQQMHTAGYHSIVSTDISTTVIEQMKQISPDLVWEVADATQLPYQNGAFDCAIDKGTLDALISGQNYQICSKMLKECMRVLKMDGQLLLVTYGSPEGRRKVFEAALPFHLFDYHQVTTDLSDSSTMINLMRGNLDGKALNHILKEEKALKKTMMEFTLLKLLRRNRKNQKKYIIWSELEKGVQSSKAKLSDLGQSDTQKDEIAAVKSSYAPKKQSYVYVYSIRRKISLNICEHPTDISSLNYKQTDNSLEVAGTNKTEQMLMRISPAYFPQILKASSYLQANKVPFGSVRAYFSTVPEETLDQTHVDIKVGSSNKIFISQQTRLSLRLNTPADIAHYQQISAKMTGICDYLSDTCQIFHMHPTPETYKQLTYLKPRFPNASINQLLKESWYPSFHIYPGSIMLYLPPHAPEQEIMDDLKERFPEIAEIRLDSKGFLTFPSGDTVSLLNSSLMSIKSARELFEPCLGSPTEHTHLNGVLGGLNAISLTEDVLQQILVHLLANI